MRCSYSTLVKAKRAGRATSVRVTPTGTAVTEYQVPLGNRHTLKEIGVVGAPSWSEKTTQTETWVKVPRLSTTCPRRVIAFDGGKGNIDRCMEFGDEFAGAALNAAKWTVVSGQPYTIADGLITVTGANDGADEIDSARSFGINTAAVFRAKQVRYTSGSSGSSYWGYRSEIPQPGSFWNSPGYGYNAGSSHLTVALHPDFARWEVARIGTTAVNFSKNRTESIWSVTTGLSSAVVPITLREYLGTGAWGAADQMVVDWLFVRKCIASEPLAGTAAPSATNRALSRRMRKADLIRACCT